SFLYLFLCYHLTSPAHRDTLSLHDALPIYAPGICLSEPQRGAELRLRQLFHGVVAETCLPQAGFCVALRPVLLAWGVREAGLKRDRKSTRLNSSHGSMSYAVFCLKNKNNSV